MGHNESKMTGTGFKDLERVFTAIGYQVNQLGVLLALKKKSRTREELRELIGLPDIPDRRLSEAINELELKGAITYERDTGTYVITPCGDEFADAWIAVLESKPFQFYMVSSEEANIKKIYAG